MLQSVDAWQLNMDNALHCTALHCTALHCTALHCTALYCTGAGAGAGGGDVPPLLSAAAVGREAIAIQIENYNKQQT